MNPRIAHPQNTADKQAHTGHISEGSPHEPALTCRWPRPRLEGDETPFHAAGIRAPLTQTTDKKPALAGPEDPEEGASTAEYGIVMLAAVGFAGLLVAILRSDEVRGMLLEVIRNALSTGG